MQPYASINKGDVRKFATEQLKSNILLLQQILFSPNNDLFPWSLFITKFKSNLSSRKSINKDDVRHLRTTQINNDFFP